MKCVIRVFLLSRHDAHKQALASVSLAAAPLVCVCVGVRREVSRVPRALCGMLRDILSYFCFSALSSVSLRRLRPV